MVGHRPLKASILVRIQAPQPASAPYRGRPKNEILSHFLTMGPGRPRPIPSLERASIRMPSKKLHDKKVG